MLCCSGLCQSHDEYEQDEDRNKLDAMKVSIGDIVSSLTFLEAHSRLILAGVDNYGLSVCDCDQWQELYHLQCHKGTINEVVTVSDDCFLACSADSTVSLWSSCTRGQAPVQKGTLVGHELSVASVAGCAKSGVVVTGGRDCRVVVWDLESMKEVSSNWIPRNVVTRVRILPQSTLVVQLSEDLQFRVWDPRVGGHASMVYSSPCGPDQLVSCAVGEDESSYVVCGSKGFSTDQCMVKIFDPRSSWREIPLSPQVSFESTVEGICYLRGSDTVMAVSKGGEIALLNTSTLEMIQRWTLGDGSPLAVTSVACCKEWIGIGSYGMNNVARMYKCDLLDMFPWKPAMVAEGYVMTDWDSIVSSWGNFVARDCGG
ncbi:WD domain, G-beta repeat [Perkinsus chesapeaki]|uniref:WD domain, G-beta repeat n=1 Tax=Perkinsus chesapeaki TaxID=330153 RepID=A0A7J6MZZ6_PERCH|nr:WD domain, G-beta repeat [Perkinsus chesapeaki]